MKKLISLALAAFMAAAMATNAYALTPNLSPAAAPRGIKTTLNISSSDLGRPKDVKLQKSGVKKLFVPHAYAAQTAVSDGSSNYGYAQLGTYEKQAYTLMKNAAQAKFIYTDANQNVISLSGMNLTEDQVYKVYTFFRDDNPQFFWLDWSYVTDDNASNTAVTEFGLMSFYNSAQIDSMKTKIDAAAAVYLDQVKNITDQYQKELALHDLMVKNLSYNDENPDLNDAHNLYGVFVSKTAVCEGYAKAFQYLLNLSGITGIYVTGESEGEGHAWDVAGINGKYYQVDTTWDDPSTGSYQEALSFPLISHCYFNISTAQLENDHTIDTGNDLYTLPACDSADEGYFVKSGYVFSSASDFESNAVADSVAQINSGSYMIELQAGSSQTLDAVSDILSGDGYNASDEYKAILDGINAKLPADRQISDSDYYFLTDDTNSNVLTIFAIRESAYPSYSSSLDETTYKTELIQNIIYAQNNYASGSDYTSASYSALSAALAAAKTANISSTASQTAVDSAAGNLLSAINALQLQTGSSVPSASAPVITIASYNTKPTNQNITVYASADKGTLNAASYTFTQNGSFDFIATASDGTSSDKTVTITNIDKTAPVISCSTAAGAVTNQNVSVSCSDNVAVASKTATVNGRPTAWPSNGVFSANGSYTVVVTDSAGNKATTTFTINKYLPVFYSNVRNGGYTTYNVQVYVTRNNGGTVTGTLNGSTIAYSPNAVYTKEGSYSFCAVNSFGNKSTFSFTIDKTAPVIAISTASGSVQVSVSDTNLATDVAYCNGKLLSWPSNNIFTVAGNYTVYAVDKAGNYMMKRFSVGSVSAVIEKKSSSLPPDNTITLARNPLSYALPFSNPFVSLL